MAQWGTKSKAARSPSSRTDGKAPTTSWGRQAKTGRRAVTTETIAKRAYEKWLARGGKHGNDQGDWFEAERELLTETGRNTN